MGEREEVVRCAKQQLGKPYVWGTHGPDTFDCSGLVGYCHNEAGVNVGYGSVYQYSLGKRVDKPQPGDVGFWDTFGDAPGHNAIYIGNDTIIHAFNQSQGVIETKLPVQNMGGANRFMGWRNLGLKDGDTKPPKGEGEGGDVPEWRNLGDMSLENFKKELKAYDSPILAEADAVYEALKGHTIFATAILYHEKKFDTYNQIIPQSYHNPFAWSSGWANGKHTWHKFSDYEDAARAWLGWVLDDDSPFANTTSVEEFVHVYAPSSDGNDEQLYVSKFEEYYKKYRTAPTPTPIPPSTGVKTGTLKAPKHQIMIVQKPWEGAGFDRVPPRNNVGMCMHKWWGYGDASSLYRLFSSGGERQADALVDWSLTQEGDLVMLNEPWKTRAGWANGPANDLEGDGVLFVRKLGVSAVNSRLVSCEFEGKDDPLTDAQMEIGSSLWAYYYDAWGISWEDYPMNPKVACNTDLDHWEIGDKACPFAGARSQRSDFQALVKGKLKAAQVGGAPDPIEPDPKPDHDWLPENLTEEIVKKMFGKGVRHNLNGTTTSFEFDMKGLISNAWLARGAKYSMYPEARDWWILDSATTPNVISFANGWVLFGSGGSRSSWTWMGTTNG